MENGVILVLPCGHSQTAAANGDREAGWIILDDLLANPGILLGEVPVVTCQQGVSLLQAGDVNVDDRGLVQRVRRVYSQSTGRDSGGYARVR